MAVTVIEIVLLALASAHLVWSFHVAPEIRVRQMSLIGYAIVLVLALMVPPAAAYVAFGICAFGVGLVALRAGDGVLWFQASMIALACAMVLPIRWWLAAVVAGAALLAVAVDVAGRVRTVHRAEREAIDALMRLGEWGQMDERFDFACQLVQEGRDAPLPDERIAAYRHALQVARQIGQQQPGMTVSGD